LTLQYQKQLAGIIALSIIFGASFNSLRDNGISWLAKPMEKVTSTSDIDKIIEEPSIREINLETARVLQENGSLFVDARAEEYLEGGFIPGAIANDDIDILSDDIASSIGYDKSFVIYCSDDECGSSEDLAYTLQEFGFYDILVFKGGWKTWTEAGLEVEFNE
jgi:3-mercaptopyruvate sulfurtransferase SseA|tara:strand:+ start:134 stop:622 length:489 start_codon:yes stop_codon:yes gene_type:complete